MVPNRIRCLNFISIFLSMSIFISGDTISENIGGGWLCVLSCAAIFLLTYTFYRLHLLKLKGDKAAPFAWAAWICMIIYGIYRGLT